MKAKLKSPEVAKAKGLDFNKKLLKRLVADPFEEPLRFFYHSEFDYGGETGVQPLLYIGEVSSLWKKYIKDHKKEKTFAAGICNLDEKGGLKLVVQAGKGGKAAVLKIINKALLKPFTRGYFVDSIDSTEEMEDIADKEDSPETDDLTKIDPKDLIAEALAFLKEGNTFFNALNALVTGLAPKLKDLRNTIVTDELIGNTKETLTAIQASPTAAFLRDAAEWLKEADEETINSESTLKKHVEDLQKLVNSLTGLQPEIEVIKTNASKIQQVQNPTVSECPPVSDDPFDNFGTVLLSFDAKSKLPKHVEDLKAF